MVDSGRAPKSVLIGIDVATSRKVWEFPFDGYLYATRFAGSDLLAAPADRGEVLLIDAGTGKLRRTLTVDRKLAQMFLAASPGGRYLAFPADGFVQLLRTADGSEAGRLNYPADATANRGGIRFLSFSPDGKRIAGVFGTDSDHRCLGWDLATGALFADWRFTTVLESLPLMQWSADSSAWHIHSFGMVDPNTGAAFWRSSRRRESSAHYIPVTTTRALRIQRNPPDSRAEIEEVQVPGEKVAAVRAAVKAGLRPVDGWLPPVVKEGPLSDRASLPARATDWTYQPDPAAAAPPAGPLARLKLPVAIGDVESCRLTPSAVVVELVRQLTYFADPLSPRTLVRFDRSTGRESGRVELPPACRLVDVSPDGSVAVTIEGDEGRRVDVWDLATGKHVAGWRPGGLKDGNGELLFAAAQSANRVVTLTRAGVLAGWSIPNGQNTFAITVPGLGVPLWSPGRKYLFGLQGKVVRVIDATSGQLAGDLDAEVFPDRWGSAPIMGPTAPPPTPFAVRADGRELALMIPDIKLSGGQVYRWDLTSGRLVKRFRYAESPFYPIAFTGPDHLFLWPGVVEAATGTAHWEYLGPGRPGRVPTSDDRIWYLAGDRTADVHAGLGGAAAMPTRDAVLVSSVLPHPAAVVALKKKGGPDDVISRGKRVQIRLDLTDVPSAQIKDSITASLFELARSRGLEPVEEASELVLTLTVKPRPSGTQRIIHKQIKGGMLVADKVETTYLRVWMNLSIKDETLWESGEVWVQPPNIYPVPVPDERADVAKIFRERVWDQVPAALTECGFPVALIRTSEGAVALPGRFELTSDGPQPARPVGRYLPLRISRPGK